MLGDCCFLDANVTHVEQTFLFHLFSYRQVCEGDRVVVDVYNSQLSDTETIHWHGLHMRGQQYYDGVPFLTQCPVVLSSFRYDFLASTPGTHFWHSHVGK